MMKGEEMSVLEGFGDLKPKDVLVFNANGTILVAMDKRIEIMQLQVSPTGCLTARKIEETVARPDAGCVVCAPGRSVWR